MPIGFVPYILSVVNADRTVPVIQPPGEDLEGVEEVDPPFTSRAMLADALALSTLSLPNDTPSDPVALPRGTNPRDPENWLAPTGGGVTNVHVCNPPPPLSSQP